MHISRGIYAPKGDCIIANHIFNIAEAGLNHNGLLELARELVKVAAECGADAVNEIREMIKT